MNKIQFLERLQAERDKFELVLNRVGFARQLTMKGVSNGMSIKDMLAEILSREHFISDRLVEIVHGEVYAACSSHNALELFQAEYGYPDYESSLLEKDSLNHLAIEKYKNIALDEIIAQELAVFSNIISALQKLTNEQCLDHDLFHRISQHTYKPYRRAIVSIDNWLKTISVES